MSTTKQRRGIDALLKVQDLKTYFYTDDGVVKALDGVDFEVERGKVLGVVGESGCGKSVTSLSILQLVPHPGRILSGSKILYYPKAGQEVDITAMAPSGKAIRSIRGNEISMIFQEPMTSLTPVYTIGKQIVEAIRLHTDLDKAAARQLAIEMLVRVGIPAPEQRVDEYPFQLSGGQRQRALIAMALACNPNFLIADEPTTALDVTIQKQILRLMKELQDDLGMSIMLITHDLGVIADIAHDVVVMYLGKIVERGTVGEIYHNPQHPYTRGLLNSVPVIGRAKRLTAIRGTVPSFYQIPEGCSFRDRCDFAWEKCQTEPGEFALSDTQAVKCWLAEGGEARSGTSSIA